MPEIGAEHADVIASPITQANDGLWSDLVGDAQAGCKRFVSVGDIACQIVFTDAADANAAGSTIIDNVREPAIALGIHCLREINLPA